VTLCNLSGQVIKSEDLDPQTDVFGFDTSTYASGLYVVKIQNREKTFVRKVIVVH
jgi:hypothetical protein